MTEPDEPADASGGHAQRLRAELQQLKQEHRDLDAAISALAEAGFADLLQLQRLKKRKLLLKDRISHLEDVLTPDIIA
ncbi:YdcH family protein [Camelimonas abortus]